MYILLLIRLYYTKKPLHLPQSLQLDSYSDVSNGKEKKKGEKKSVAVAVNDDGSFDEE